MQAVSRANSLNNFALKKIQNMKPPPPRPTSTPSATVQKKSTGSAAPTVTAPYSGGKKRINAGTNDMVQISEEEVITHHVFFTWKDASLLQHCGFVLPMYSGIVYGSESTVGNNMTVAVSECGTVLEYRCAWPHTTLDVKLLCSAVTEYTADTRSRAAMEIGFNEKVNQVRETLNLSEAHVLLGYTKIDIHFT